MAIELIVAIALVIANGYFVATEFAIARLRPTQVEEFERAGRPGAASVRHAVEHIDAYLAACQLGITVASLGLGVVASPCSRSSSTACSGTPRRSPASRSPRCWPSR